MFLNLLSNDVCRLGGVVALVDDVTDLLVGHDEVDAVGGENQERVVSVLQLQTWENNESRFDKFCAWNLAPFYDSCHLKG